MKDASKQKKRRWHWGDRPDGYKLRTVNPMTRMMPYIMPQRADACNYFADSIDMTKTDRFCREKVRAGMTNFGFLHILIASYIFSLPLTSAPSPNVPPSTALSAGRKSTPARASRS